ncbi:MAG: hypothetical protein ACOCRX_00925 [Candidatus Woesearchaeota archaeon]
MFEFDLVWTKGIIQDNKIYPKFKFKNDISKTIICKDIDELLEKLKDNGYSILKQNNKITFSKPFIINHLDKLLKAQGAKAKLANILGIERQRITQYLRTDGHKFRQETVYLLAFAFGYSSKNIQEVFEVKELEPIEDVF